MWTGEQFLESIFPDQDSPLNLLLSLGSWDPRYHILIIIVVILISSTLQSFFKDFFLLLHVHLKTKFFLKFRSFFPDLLMLNLDWHFNLPPSQACVGGVLAGSYSLTIYDTFQDKMTVYVPEYLKFKCWWIMSIYHYKKIISVFLI